MLSRARGFTLIELLVVIAIIGLLSSVVLASLSTAREKALDAQRVSNVKALKTALQMYYDDYGSYPSASSAESVSNLATPLAGYIAKIPTDPVSSVNWYYQSCASACKEYALEVYTEAHGTCVTSDVSYPSSWFLGSAKCSF